MISGLAGKDALPTAKLSDKKSEHGKRSMKQRLPRTELLQRLLRFGTI